MDKKTKFINYVLWAAFILALASSVQHIAWTFGTVEQPGREWLGWLPALAVDAGMAALAYAIQQRRKAKRSVVAPWIGVVIFAMISALANFFHALTVESGGITTLAAIGAIDPLLIAKAAFLSATLPALVVYLSEIVSSDDAVTARASETAAEREQAKAKRDQDRADKAAAADLLKAETAALEAKRLLLEAEAAALKTKAEAEERALEAKAKAEASEKARAEAEAAAVTTALQPAVVAPVLVSETVAFPCADCGRLFRSVNARNAHKCESKRTSEVVFAVSEPGSNGRAHDS